jgi:hypothetical protein
VQPPVATTTQPRLKATTERHNSHNGRPPLARQSEAPGRATRRSCRPALTCSVPGGGTDAAQSSILTGPSLPSGFPSGLSLSPRGAVSASLTMFITRQIRSSIQSYPPVQQKYETISRWQAATTHGPTRCAPTCNAYWERTTLEQKLSSYSPLLGQNARPTRTPARSNHTNELCEE